MLWVAMYASCKLARARILLTCCSTGWCSFLPCSTFSYAKHFVFVFRFRSTPREPRQTYTLNAWAETDAYLRLPLLPSAICNSAPVSCLLLLLVETVRDVSLAEIIVQAPSVPLFINQIAPTASRHSAVTLPRPSVSFCCLRRNPVFVGEKPETLKKRLA